MTNAEAVIEVLKLSGCLTANEISSMAMRKFKHEMTPAQVSGAIRSLEGKDKVISSRNADSQRVFWLKKGDSNDSV